MMAPPAPLRGADGGAGAQPPVEGGGEDVTIGAGELFDVRLGVQCSSELGGSSEAGKSFAAGVAGRVAAAGERAPAALDGGAGASAAMPFVVAACAGAITAGPAAAEVVSTVAPRALGRAPLEGGAAEGAMANGAITRGPPVVKGAADAAVASGWVARDAGAALAE
jgi:hypothetical protein